MGWVVFVKKKCLCTTDGTTIGQTHSNRPPEWIGELKKYRWIFLFGSKSATWSNNVSMYQMYVDKCVTNWHLCQLTWVNLFTKCLTPYMKYPKNYGNMRDNVLFQYIFVRIRNRLIYTIFFFMQLVYVFMQGNYNI